jgi:hypothetical protein
MRRPLAIAALLLVTPLWGQPSDLERETKRALARAGDDAQAQVAVVEALAAQGDADACSLLASLAVNDRLSWQARDAGRTSLLRQGGAHALLWAGEAARQAKAPRVRALACQLLGRLTGSDPRALDLLAPALDDDDALVRAAAIAAISNVREPRTVEALVRCLQAAEGRVAGDCVRALRALTGERHGSAAEWASWWAAVGEGYALPSPEDEAVTAAAPQRSRTVTRLEAPGAAGRTIYEDIDSSRVLFVVDVSYSMRVRVMGDESKGLTRLDYVKAELARAIEEQLDEEDRFNVIAFSEDVRAWKGKLTPAKARNKKAALKFVRGLRPDADTNISDSLELAFLDGEVDTIYFLTDGNPTRGKLIVNDEILAAVRAWNAGRGIRLHTVAFLAGDAEAFQVIENKGMATRFLRALADENQGTFSLFE